MSLTLTPTGRGWGKLNATRAELRRQARPQDVAACERDLITYGYATLDDGGHRIAPADADTAAAVRP